MQDESLVTSDDVAARFGVAVGTVNYWVRSGRIPCLRPSRRIVRFRMSEVERALEQPRSDGMPKEVRP